MENTLTYQHKVTFLSRSFDGVNHTEADISRMVTFKEFSRTDDTQHGLAFKIVAIWQAAEKKNPKDPQSVLLFDPEMLGDLTKMCVSSLTIIDAEFTERNRQEVLSDVAAIIRLGMWLLPNKIVPFFLTLMGGLDE